MSKSGERPPQGQDHRGPAPGGRSSVVTLFRPGDVVSDRFRIVRFLAQGGMGEVYEADDLALSRRVALKSLRPDVTEDEQAVERFKREIQLATTVTHPNICRIFDLGRHTSEDGEDFSFLTMEMLEGETLSERLRRSGRMRADEVMPILRQLAAALDAAHAAGVIHRDLKSANIMLVDRTPSGAHEREGSGAGSLDGGLRVVVTDFGLARTSGKPEREAITGITQFVGTPEYMAPEQVTGRAVTPETDVYALGIVLYEMLSGRPPFLGDTPLSTAAKRLEEAAPLLSVSVPEVPRRFEEAIQRCLEREPAKRFPSAGALLLFLDGRPSMAADPRRDPETLELPRSAIRRRRTRRRLLLGTALAIGMGVLVLAGMRWWRELGPASASAATGSAAAAATRRSVAVLGFRNLTGRPEEDWLSTALSEMLTTELGAGSRLRTIPGENVAKARHALSLPDSPTTLSESTLARVRKSLACDLVVLGAYYAPGSEGRKVRLDLIVQDARTGEALVAATENGSEADLAELVARMGRALRERLGVGELSQEDAGALQAARPRSAEAARLYSEGLESMRAFRMLEARERLDAAVQAEPSFPPAHAALAEVWSFLGHDARAREAARKAFELSGKLGRSERLFVEGRYRELMREWDRAVTVYRGLWTRHPDDVDCALRLAAVQTNASRPKDALATVDSMRALPPPVREDPRIDLAEARALFALSDLARLKLVADQAARKGEGQEAGLIVAEARWLQGLALRDLGETEAARRALDASRRLFLQAGDRAGASRAMNAIGVLLWRQGELEKAREIFEEFLATSRELGYQTGMSWALSNLGDIEAAHGELPSARRRYEEALGLFREIGAQKSAASASASVAWVLYSQGSLEEARKLYEETLPVMREAGSKSSTGVLLNSLGIVLLAQGDLRGARARVEEAYALFAEIGQKSYLGEALQTLGTLSLHAGDLASAREAYTRALELRNELKEEGAVHRVRLLLARLAVEEGRPADAEGPARAAAEAFAARRQTQDEAFARQVLARALLESGDLAGAKGEIELAETLAIRSGTFEARGFAQLLAAQVLSSSGRSAEARRHAQAIAIEARRAGHQHLLLQARLVQARLDLAPNAEEGAALSALEKDAQEKGFGLIARRAAQMASR